jgi:hypothetical protein
VWGWRTRIIRWNGQLQTNGTLWKWMDGMDELRKLRKTDKNSQRQTEGGQQRVCDRQTDGVWGGKSRQLLALQVARSDAWLQASAYDWFTVQLCTLRVIYVPFLSHLLLLLSVRFFTPALLILFSPAHSPSPSSLLSAERRGTLPLHLLPQPQG